MLTTIDRHDLQNCTAYIKFYVDTEMEKIGPFATARQEKAEKKRLQGQSYLAFQQAWNASGHRQVRKSKLFNWTNIRTTKEQLMPCR